MTTWNQFAQLSPDLAAFGHTRFQVEFAFMNQYGEGSNTVRRWLAAG